MSVPHSLKRAAVIGLLRRGLVTYDEAAGLASTSRRVVEDWAAGEGIDIATTRATYLLTTWRSELADERARRWTGRELSSEQMRLDRAWERHLDGQAEEEPETRKS